jgi:hypothetical protein
MNALPLLLILAQTCPYEENCSCAVPGITIRWKAAYCMALNQTDDLEQRAVSACIAQREPPILRGRGACAKNEHWKREMCRVLVRGDGRKITACVLNPTTVPSIVKKGPGV